MSCAVLGLMIGAPALAATKPEVATPPPPKEASFHVKCDGNPNNMSGAESAVRMITLAAVVGLLAPPPEAADPTKRKLGADGVAACDAVLTGDKAETNVNRRMQLTLARALHQIEAKNYTAAIADVALARKEATAAGLTADRYFMQSAGMSFDRIEAAALIRMGKEEEAATVAARSVEEHRFNLLPLLRNDVYPEFSRSGKDALWYDYVAWAFCRCSKSARRFNSVRPQLYEGSAFFVPARQCCLGARAGGQLDDRNRARGRSAQQ
jgi:hypothetical protein